MSHTPENVSGRNHSRQSPPICDQRKGRSACPSFFAVSGYSGRAAKKSSGVNPGDPNAFGKRPACFASRACSAWIHKRDERRRNNAVCLHGHNGHLRIWRWISRVWLDVVSRRRSRNEIVEKHFVNHSSIETNFSKPSATRGCSGTGGPPARATIRR